MAQLASISKGRLRMQLQDIVGQPVAVYPGFKALGIGHSGVSLLSQAVYWTERTATNSGWFYKSQEEWESEIGLSRSEQELARKKLVAIGVLQEERKGIPCRLHYRVDTERLMEIMSNDSLLAQAQETCNQVCRKPASQYAGNLQTGVQETCKQASGKPASRHAGKPQTITENTQEITTETTAEIIAAPVVVAAKKRSRKPADEHRQEACRGIWSSYASAYQDRYGTAPVRNAKTNRQVVNLWERLGAEAQGVAEFFVQINDSYLIRNCHDLGLLLARCESYRTQWATGRQMTGTTAQQIERRQANLDAGQEAARRIIERSGSQEGANEFLI